MKFGEIESQGYEGHTFFEMYVSDTIHGFKRRHQRSRRGLGLQSYNQFLVHNSGRKDPACMKLREIESQGYKGHTF